MKFQSFVMSSNSEVWWYTGRYSSIIKNCITNTWFFYISRPTSAIKSAKGSAFTGGGSVVQYPSDTG